MNFGIKNKRALVTGAGRGLGRAIALSLMKEGALVAVVSRTKKDLIDLFTELGGKKGGHRALVFDLCTRNAPGQLVDKLSKTFGPVDILVNNLGGTLDVTDPFCPVDKWRKLWRLNLEVAIELNNYLIPAMKKKGWGRIVNISSISALENQGPVPYCTIKAALVAYTRGLGRVVAGSGIIMTSVLPGAVYTKDGYWDKTSLSKPGHVKKYLEERMAIKRFGRPEEIADMVVFLCSKQASFCVGSMVPVDGGQGRCFFQ